MMPVKMLILLRTVLTVHGHRFRMRICISVDLHAKITLHILNVEFLFSCHCSTDRAAYPNIHKHTHTHKQTHTHRHTHTHTHTFALHPQRGVLVFL